jgi:hypothetical protein
LSDGAEDRFFFVHVRKTAGISLMTRLRNHFGEAAVYPNKTDKVTVPVSADPMAGWRTRGDVEYLLERWSARGDEIRVVSGHFPLCTAELLGGGFTTLTLLRDPVERTLSHLRHHRLWWPADRDVPLETLYEDAVRLPLGQVHNHMVKMFSLTPEEMTAGALTPVDFTQERLERAKKRLASVDALGLQDSFDEFCAALERRFGWNLGEPLRANRTEPFEVPDAFRARIAEDNAMDVELYEFAKQLLLKRTPGGEDHHLRGTSRVAAARKTS